MANEKIKDIEIPKFSKFVSNNEFTNKCIGLLKITTGNSKSNIKIIVNYFSDATTKLFIKKQANKNDPAPDTSIFVGLYDKMYQGYTIYGSGTNTTYELESNSVYYVVGYIYQHNNKGGKYNVCEIQYMDENSSGNRYFDLQ